MYGPGKKYIEAISLFINEPSIDLNFRTLQIIHLLSDEGLTHSCAEGCFTRLQYAANNLKKFSRRIFLLQNLWPQPWLPVHVRAVRTHLEIILDSTIFLKKEAQSGLLFNELNPI